MVTYFNRKDLVSFGSYLLSEKRKASFKASYEEKINSGVIDPILPEESMQYVHHSDIQNWLREQEENQLCPL